MEAPYEEQYSQEGNPRAYMTMRDYRNVAWQNQQPLGRNPNPNRSMRDYREQWMSAPVYSVPSTYTPLPHPQYASLSQPQPSQPISPVEQAILDLTKLVGDAVGEQKKFNAQLSQKIHTVENSLDQRLDGLQSEMDKKIDNLHYSISRLAQHDHQEEGNPKGECIDTVLGEQTQLPGREAGGGRGKEEWEEPQKNPSTNSHRIEPHCHCPSHQMPTASSPLHRPSVYSTFTCNTIHP